MCIVHYAAKRGGCEVGMIQKADPAQDTVKCHALTTEHRSLMGLKLRALKFVVITTLKSEDQACRTQKQQKRSGVYSLS